MHAEFTFLGVINPIFLSPLGYHRIVNPSTICPTNSLTCLRSLSFVSWKLCECIETDRDRQSSIDIDRLAKYSSFRRLMSYKPFIGNSPLCSFHLQSFSSEYCANAYWIHVFGVINPLLPNPLGDRRIFNLFTTSPIEPLILPTKFQLCTYLKNCTNACWISIFP